MFDPSYLRAADPEIFSSIEDELTRQRSKIELIASENSTSAAVMVAQGSVLTNKYAEGYPGARYYGGCVCVDRAETLAQQRACALFQAEHANVQPHSGAQANMAAYFALVQPGDRILGMDLAAGGHLSHGARFNSSGKIYQSAFYGVDPKTETIDYDALMQQAKEWQPKLIIAGASAYPRTLHFDRFREIADACGAYLLTDMAHIAGLVAAGAHPSPLPYSEIVTSTTHKTLRGPRGGLILCGEAFAKAVDKAVFPGLQGGPLMHVVAAKAVAFGEALQPAFRDYIFQVVANAQALAEGLREGGLRLVSGGTDNHLMLVDVRPAHLTGAEAEAMLDEIGITCNKNCIPFDPEKSSITSGIRLGTPAITTRGFQEEDVRQLARAICLCLTGGAAGQEKARAIARELTEAHPLYAEAKQN